MCYLVRNAPEIPAGVLQVKCVSQYWELTLRNGDAESGHRRHPQEESSVCHQDLLSSLGVGAEREERPQLIWGWDCGLGLEVRRESEDLKICFSDGVWLLGSQCLRQMEADVVVKKSCRRRSLGDGRGERVQQVVCTELGKRLGDWV